MQALLKDLVSSLHDDYFKKHGFKKKQAHFTRVLDDVFQEVDFQSSQWNSKGEAITFYVNFNIGFTDLPLKNDAIVLGTGRIAGLVSGAPAQFDLTEQNQQAIYDELIGYLPRALEALPLHYEDVRERASRGYMTPIPLPDSWRTEQN